MGVYIMMQLYLCGKIWIVSPNHNFVMWLHGTLALHNIAFKGTFNIQPLQVHQVHIVVYYLINHIIIIFIEPLGQYWLYEVKLLKKDEAVRTAWQ